MMAARRRRGKGEAAGGAEAGGEAGGEAERGLVAAGFRPAAGYLLQGEPRLPPGIELVRVDDTDVGPILTHPHDTIIGTMIRDGKTWEPDAGRFLRWLLRPGMHAIDVGANIGYFTLLMAQAVGPAGRVLAIEAEPENFHLLRANIELHDLPRVELLPVAAHRAPGLVTIIRDPGNHGQSWVGGDHAGWSASPAQAVRLDDVLDPAARIDAIKIDVEGMDHAVVEGLRETVRRWRPVILVELNPRAIGDRGDDPHAVLGCYRELGYEVRLLGGDVVRLHREAGMALDELLLDNLVVRPEMEAELIARGRTIDFINLVLWPKH